MRPRLTQRCDFAALHAPCLLPAPTRAIDVSNHIPREGGEGGGGKPISRLCLLSALACLL